MMVAVCVTNASRTYTIWKAHTRTNIAKKHLVYMTGIKCFSKVLSVVDLIIHIFENKILYVFKYKCDCIYPFRLGLSLKELSLLIHIMRFIFLNETGHMTNLG